MKKIDRHSKYLLDGKYAWLCWFICVSFTIWLHVIQTGYAIFNHHIQENLQLSIWQIGFVAAMYPCISAAFQLFSGTLMDRVGPRRTIIPAIFISVIGVFILSISEHLYQLVLAQFLLSLGGSFGFVGSGYIISKWFSPIKFGMVLGLVQVMVSFSAAFGQMGFDIALVHFHWRKIILLFVLFGLVLVSLSFLYIRLPNTLMHKKESMLDTIKDLIKKNIYILKNRNICMCCMYGGISYGFIWALGAIWLPKLVQSHGLTLSIANISSFSMWIGVALGCLVVDKIWKKIGDTKKTLLLYVIIQFVSLVGIVYFPLTPTRSVFFSAAMGIGTSGHMLIFTIAKESLPPTYSGGAISIISASMFLIGGILLGIIGWGLGILGESLRSYQIIMSVFIFGILFELISMFFITEKKY